MKRAFYILSFAGMLVVVIASSSCDPSKSRNTLVSADTSLMLQLNGLDQYVEIHGQSEKYPVLLFIHGGPSWPATPMIRSRSCGPTPAPTHAPPAMVWEEVT